MLYLIIAFLFSFLTSIILIRINKFRDEKRDKRKVHETPVPRVGGLSVLSGVLSANILTFVKGKPFALNMSFIIISSLPVFFAGLLEDITGRIPPKLRLGAGVVSSVIAFYLIPARVTRTDIPFLDALLNIEIFSLAFTAFALTGLSQAFNIIDGFNGLASGVAMLVFGAYAYVAFLHNDMFLLYVSLIFLFATLGFFLWNYPWGLIFLGDGGAYLLGFVVGVVGILLTSRHPDVSPWFPLLLVIYPVWETLFSIYRRKFLKNTSPYSADALHFHQLLYRRLISFVFGRDIEQFKKNSYTSPLLWVLELFCLFPAVMFWDNTQILMFCTLLFILIYTWLYFRLVKFKTPYLLKWFLKLFKV